MKRLAILLIWFPTTIVTLIFSLSYYGKMNQPETVYLPPIPLNSNLSLNDMSYQLYASLPEVLGAQTVNAYYIESQDIIPELIFNYLKKFNSPMLHTAQELVTSARKFGVDPLFMIAIAQCESGLGKKMPHSDTEDPYSCHNPFGWGIHSQGTLCFQRWEEGYETVAKGLKEKYFSQGLANPQDIMEVYTPASLEKGGSWARCVSQYLTKLNEFKETL